MSKQRILKYPITSGVVCLILDAQDFKPLCVQMQGGTPCLWAVVTDSGDTTHALHVKIAIVCTGHEFDAIQAGEYVGTYQQDWFVGHVFCEVVK